MRPVIPVALIGAWWILATVVLGPWAANAPEFASRSYMALQTATDAAGAVCAYGVSFAYLMLNRSAVRGWVAAIVSACFAVMLLVETGARFWGASASEGGDPMYRLSSVCPFERFGYSSWPSIGVAAGMAMALFFSRRRIGSVTTASYIAGTGPR